MQANHPQLAPTIRASLYIDGEHPLESLRPGQRRQRLVTIQPALWMGTDIIATYHLTFRELLLHPELMAFYQREGKWMDYLGERVPEYAALREIEPRSG